MHNNKNCPLHGGVMEKGEVHNIFTTENAILKEKTCCIFIFLLSPHTPPNYIKKKILPTQTTQFYLTKYCKFNTKQTCLIFISFNPYYPFFLKRCQNLDPMQGWGGITYHFSPIIRILIQLQNRFEYKKIIKENSNWNILVLI